MDGSYMNVDELELLELTLDDELELLELLLDDELELLELLLDDELELLELLLDEEELELLLNDELELLLDNELELLLDNELELELLDEELLRLDEDVCTTTMLPDTPLEELINDELLDGNFSLIYALRPFRMFVPEAIAHRS